MTSEQRLLVKTAKMELLNKVMKAGKIVFKPDYKDYKLVIEKEQWEKIMNEVMEK